VLLQILVVLVVLAAAVKVRLPIVHLPILELLIQAVAVVVAQGTLTHLFKAQVVVVQELSSSRYQILTQQHFRLA
jgi:hypothetical protein